MQTDEQSMLCSLGYLETETSLALILPDSRGQGPRFRRSRSGERSRSKENCHNNENPSFFVKNCFPLHANPHHTHDTPDTTPQKSRRRNNHVRSRETESAQKTNDSNTLSKQCDELNLLLEKSHSYIMELEGRISDLEEELRERSSLGGDREKAGRAKEGRGNLAKLRKQIADTRTVETAPLQALAQQVRMLQAENLCLKEEIQTLKNTIHLQEQTATHAQSQRQNELQATINRLRESLQGSEKREGQLQMEVGRLRLRESKQTDNQQQARSEELSYLRFRYQKMRKKFQQNKKALEALQRRQEASSYLFRHEEREVSLSLSP